MYQVIKGIDWWVDLSAYQKMAVVRFCLKSGMTLRKASTYLGLPSVLPVQDVKEKINELIQTGSHLPPPTSPECVGTLVKPQQHRDVLSYPVFHMPIKKKLCCNNRCKSDNLVPKLPFCKACAEKLYTSRWKMTPQIRALIDAA